jgi:hypothetical protein
MIDREFSVRDYDQGFRDGWHEANAEISRLRGMLEQFACFCVADETCETPELCLNHKARLTLERK